MTERTSSTHHLTVAPHHGARQPAHERRAAAISREDLRIGDRRGTRRVRSQIQHEHRHLAQSTLRQRHIQLGHTTVVPGAAHDEPDGIGILLEHDLSHLSRDIERTEMYHLETGVTHRVHDGDSFVPDPVSGIIHDVVSRPGAQRSGDHDSESRLHAGDTTGVKRDTRSLLIAVGTLFAGITVLLVTFILALPSLSGSGKVESRIGAGVFDAGPADQRAATIARGGPLLFSDVAAGQLDIWLQHTGDDPDSGWVAFAARRQDASRECTLRWDPDSSVFTDPCDGTEISPDGEGMTHYAVEVNEDGYLVIDFKTSPDGTAVTQDTGTRDTGTRDTGSPDTGAQGAGG